MSNILVTNISLLQEKKEEYTYTIQISDCVEKELLASNSNEIILKTLLNMQSVNNPNGLNTIIALVSNAVSDKEKKFSAYDNYNSFDYYIKIAKELFPGVKIQPILLQEKNGNYRSISSIVNDICCFITKNDTIFIDSAGGLRTVSNVIQLLIKILKYKGIGNTFSLYAELDRNTKHGFVNNPIEFTEMTNLADAFNEFMTSGKSFQLANYFNSKKDIAPEIKSLINSMNCFSENIFLGQLSQLEKTVKELENNIYRCEKLKDVSDIGIVLIKQFLPTIKEKLLGVEENHVDYVRIVNWCLDNMLIQQALTIYNEKIPRYLFEHNYLKMDQEEIDLCKKEKQSYNEIGYYAILKSIKYKYSAKEKKNVKENPLVKDFKENVKLLDSKTNYPTLASLINKIQNIEIIKKQEPLYSEDLKLLKECMGQRTFNKKENFLNAVSNLSPEEINHILGIKETIVTDELYTLSEFITKLENGYIPSGYKFLLDNKKIASIICGWWYVHERRNKMNHASSEDTSNSEDKAILEKYGYDLDTDNCETIKANMKKAMEFLI